MRYTLFIFITLIIVFSLLQNAWWLALPAILYCTFKFSGLPLIVLAILIDGYFGAFSGVPFLSLMAVCWYGFSESIRPRLRLL